MMSSQLGRTLLSHRTLSADQQDAAPDERGSYGDLIDEIDRLLGEGQSHVEDPQGSNDADEAPRQSDE